MNLVKKTLMIKINIIGGGVAAFELSFALRFHKMFRYLSFQKYILLEKNIKSITVRKNEYFFKRKNVIEIKKNEFNNPSDINLI